MKSNRISLIIFSIGILLSSSAISIGREGGVYEPDSNRIFLNVQGSFFFRNNEYFNPVYKGYTLPGVNGDVHLVWEKGPATRISAGVFAVKYSGKDYFQKLIPILSLEHSFTTRLKGTMGSFRGGSAHRLSDPVFFHERDLTGPVEEGLRLEYEGRKIWTDVWLHWENFQWWGDTGQEKLSGGVSMLYKLRDVEEGLQLNIPAYFIATHKGGQIDVNPDPMQTLVNTGAGVQVGLRLSGGFITEAGVKGNIHQFADFSPQKQLPFKMGYAFDPGVFLHSQHIKLESSWWQGNSYYSPKGNPMYQSLAFTDASYWPERKMVSTRLTGNFLLKGNIKAGLGFEQYYDLNFKEFDYSWFVHMDFSGIFGLFR